MHVLLHCKTEKPRAKLIYSEKKIIASFCFWESIVMKLDPDFSMYACEYHLINQYKVQRFNSNQID